MSNSRTQPPHLVVHEGTTTAATPAPPGADGRGPGGRGPGPGGSRQKQVHFNRAELNQILTVYGRKVADGEWRDYAMDGLKDMAIFSVFRRTSEMPLYRIEKHPKLARRQGAYRVVSATGAIIKRGHDLAQVLKVFEKRRLTVVE